MKKLYSHTLYISNVKNSLDFYINKLGMILLEEKKDMEKDTFTLGFKKNSNEAVLELVYEKDNSITLFPKDKTKLEGYWKIAISIKDVDIARSKLLKNDIEVSEPFQVPKVAYLCHFYDPDGYCLELIQHKFHHNHVKEKEDETYVLGNKPVFSLITYRVTNIKESLDFYKKTLGMKLLSKMDVHQRGFELYFLGFTEEELPVDDIEAIKNRQWLWQRDFTMIELQYILGNEELEYEVGKSTGFEKITIQTDKNEIIFDPDNYKIEQIK